MTTKRKAPAKRPTMALAKRKAQHTANTRRLAMAGASMPERIEQTIGTLTDDVQLGMLGTFEIKLSDKEESVLARPVDATKVMVIEEAEGTPIYLPHGEYTRWFNEAFGRLGWAITPCAKPSIVTSPNGQQTVTVPYIFWIHGKPACTAVGEQDYHVKNKQATYGNAYEATTASALRRCAKRMGVGLELWDRDFQRMILSERGIRGKRYRDDSRPVEGGAPPRDEPRETSYSGTTSSTEPISEKQLRRLFAISKNAGRLDADVGGWLKRRYGISKSTDVTRNLYAEICAAIEAPAPLPEK